MLRKILAVIIGVVATSLAVGAVQAVGHYFYPYPQSLDPNNPEDVKIYVKTAPFMALFFVIISYAAGGFIGGFVSTKIAQDNKIIYALIIGVLFLLVSIYMMMIIPSPIWFWVLGITVWGLVLVGYRLANCKRI